MMDPAAQGEDTAPVERRLATILMADVFGYSCMMGEDEERTVRIFRGHRAVFDELLKMYRGRIFNTAGDAILAEFPSAVEAVRCATEIQAALRTRNEHLPEAQRMWFRIGIKLERSAAAAAEKEAKLLGELQSAREALNLAETTKRKAEQARRLASVAQNAASKTAGDAQSPPPLHTVAASQTPTRDGTYIGRMCSTNPDGSVRCWGVGLTVERDALSATWPSRFNREPAHAKGSIAADGSVSFTLDGYSQSGRALTGTMSGRIGDGKVAASGAWSNRVPINANWVITQ